MTISLQNAIAKARECEQERRDERMYRERDVKNIMFHFGQSLDGSLSDEQLRRDIDDIFDFDERRDEKAKGKSISLK